MFFFRKKKKLENVSNLNNKIVKIGIDLMELKDLLY